MRRVRSKALACRPNSKATSGGAHRSIGADCQRTSDAVCCNLTRREARVSSRVIGLALERALVVVARTFVETGGTCLARSGMELIANRVSTFPLWEIIKALSEP